MKKKEVTGFATRPLPIAFKIMFLDGVIGRRGMIDTASSLWPRQKHYLKNYND
ncbi:hypothetical protein [Desulfosarcina ovata]|uniref:hypothetical protein n=1 Tax=Desulfosarcina ovata TaxID=83564 RepID=UPI0012D2B0E5|nr:hypothetical protein [Desulfosarcina ovata]